MDEDPVDASVPHRLSVAAADPAPYRARRAAVCAALRAGGGGVALLPTADACARNADSDHAYRHDSAFYWLTGFAEPGAWLVLQADGRSLIVCRERDPAMELWNGRRLGAEAAPAALGVDAALPLGALEDAAPGWLADQPAVWFPIAGRQVSQDVQRWSDALRRRSRAGAAPPVQHRDLLAVVDELRLVKDAHEVALLRRAGQIGAAGHRRAMRACRPGLSEHELEAELLYEFRRLGASGPAYTPIVASGANACVLHHVAGAEALGPGGGGTAPLRAGELCLIDAGCEYGSYASDITRTFPIDGRFTPEQRTLYELVLAAQQAAIDVTRPGARKIEAHWAAARVLSAGLLDLGLLDGASVGGVDDVMASAAYRRFFMHGTGHWLGLDVHDCGDVLAPDEPPCDQPDGSGGRVFRRPSRVLAPGMVVTVEPGLYVRPAADVDPRWWNLGIRIEDDALVTPSGCELLSREVPVAVAEIEALMRG